MRAIIPSEGEIYLPASLRSELQLVPGQTVIWEKVSATECRMLIETELDSADPRAAVGFAQQHGLAGGTTEEWMKVLRDGEED